MKVGKRNFMDIAYFHIYFFEFFSIISLIFMVKLDPFSYQIWKSERM